MCECARLASISCQTVYCIQITYQGCFSRNVPVVNHSTINGKAHHSFVFLSRFFFAYFSLHTIFKPLLLWAIHYNWRTNWIGIVCKREKLIVNTWFKCKPKDCLRVNQKLSDSTTNSSINGLNNFGGTKSTNFEKHRRNVSEKLNRNNKILIYQKKIWISTMRCGMIFSCKFVTLQVEWPTELHYFMTVEKILGSNRTRELSVFVSYSKYN